MSGSDSGAVRTSPTLKPLISTRNLGLTNSTGTLISYTTANDGFPHFIWVGLTLVVTVAETGGQVTVTYTVGGTAMTVIAFAGGAGIGNTNNGVFCPCDSNTAVAVVQASALTAGTAFISASISGG